MAKAEDVIGRTKRVLFFGRFQPLHLGHTAALKWLLDRYEEVVILIGMADESHTWVNPFTAGERLLMIRAALEHQGIDFKRITTATIHTLRVYSGNAGYVLNYVPPVDAVATANPSVRRAFKDAGVKVVTPPLVNRDKWCGEYIRRLMVLGNTMWRELLPRGVPEIIDAINGVERVREIAEDNYVSYTSSLEVVVKACTSAEQQ